MTHSTAPHLEFGYAEWDSYAARGSHAGSRSRKEYRPALDGLRAVAVAAVIGYHLVPRQVPGGFLGVDLFFVLSGYLITGSLIDLRNRYGRAALAAFWARRARRLLPALLLMLTVVALAVRVFEPASAWPQREGELLAALGYYANWHMIAGQASYFVATGTAGPLTHMWSLAVEEQFYLAWPLLLAVLLHRRWQRAAVPVLAALVAASAATMIAVYQPGDPTRAYAGTDARVQELLLGALLLFLTRNTDRVGGSSRFAQRDAAGRFVHTRVGRLPGVVGAVALAALILAIAVVPDGTGFYYRGGATLVAAVCAVLLWSVQSEPATVLARALATRVPRSLGRISYGAYLWHVPVLTYLPSQLPQRTPAAINVLAVVAVTLVLATVSFQLLERPVRYGRLRLLLDTPHRVAAAAFVAAVACTAVILASTTWATGLQAQQFAAAAAADSGGGAVSTGDPASGAGALCPDTTSLCVRLLPRAGHRTLAVIGDSQARSLDPGFYELAARKGWGYVMAAHNGCGLTGMENIEETTKPFLHECAVQTLGRIQALLDTYHPDLVISLSRWELIDHLDAAGNRVRAGSKVWAEDVQASLLNFARTVVGAGAKLVNIEVLPLASNGPACATDPGKAGCTAAPDHLTFAANQIYQQVRVQVPGVEVLSMQDQVCPGGTCRDVIGNQLIRYDGEHFTTDGARWFVDRMTPRLP